MATPTREQLVARIAELELQQAENHLRVEDGALAIYDDDGNHLLTLYLWEWEKLMELCGPDCCNLNAFIAAHWLELSTQSFRIYTEDKNREGIEAIMAERFDGFTVIPATGYWRGQREGSVILQVDTEETEENREKILEAARCIRLLNNQQAVLVESLQTKIEIAASFEEVHLRFSREVRQLTDRE